MIRLRQVNVRVDADKNELLKQCAKKLKIDVNDIKNYKIIKKSIDARDRSSVAFSYEVDIIANNEKKILHKNKSRDIMAAPEEAYKFEVKGTENIKNRPIIVGSGPAGLFCAYMLAKYGYKPLIIERGEKIEDRVKTVEKFWKENILNTQSNVQFGEGGAGTFSDGKLNTLVKDKEHRIKKILEIFVEAGAPEEILYINKPHIGTDLLRNVIINLRNKIIEMGGEIKYNSCVTNLSIENNQVVGVDINNKEKITSNIVILAIGHSARDTFKMLYENQVNMEAKPFAVGVRVQHLQSVISKSQYGEFSKFLPPASYKLTYKASNGRGVYSFCMCPGGFVVNASSEKGRLAINGMSNHERDTQNANSAIIVTVTPADFENDIFGVMKFQEELEQKAYKIGKGKIPVQLLGDFVKNVKSKNFGTIKPIFKGGYELANLQEILPEFIIEPLVEAFEYFNKKIKGFSDEDAILAAVETRTSAPVRILMDENGESNILGIYPIGEGAGYAGGIMSSAMDGLKAAEQIVKRYKS